MEHNLFVCNCGDVDHQFIIRFFDDDFITIESHLSNTGLWNRIKYAVRYVLGKKSRYNSGAFGEVLLDKTQTGMLIETLKKHHERMI